MDREQTCNCESCGAEYTVIFGVIPKIDSEDDELYVDANDVEPVYCTFCGGRLDGYDESVDA